MCECADEETDDCHFRHEEGGGDVGEGEASGEQQRKQLKREGDEPLDVPHILFTRLENTFHCRERM